MLPYLRLSTVVTCISALLISLPAAAQIEEIIVTAQKREQSVQDVPISISTMTSEQFDVFNVLRADELEFAFANVGTNRNAGGNTGISIRGVGTDNVHLSGQQSVGTYIDDVSMVSPYVSAIAIFDTARVEVLRGPQNTLNTTGGAIIWHTNKANPGDGTNGYGRLRMGNGGLMRFEGAVGFDISEQWAARIAVLSDEFDGVWTNVVDGSDTGGGYDRTGGRLNLVWDNDNGTSVGLTISSGELEGEDLPVRMSGNRLATGLVDPEFENRRADSLTGVDNNFVTATSADVAAQPYLQAQYDQGTGVVIDNPDPTAGAWNRLINYSTPMGSTYQHPEHGYDADWDGIRLLFEHDFTSMQFSSLTSYDETHVIEMNAQELTGFAPAREGDWEVLQQEFRLTSTHEGPVQWLAGLYFMDSDSTEDTFVSNVSGAGGMGVRPGVDINSSYEAWSVYGQLDWAATDALTLSAGLRHTDDELSAANDNWIRTICGFHPSHVGLRSHTREYRAADCPDGVRLGGSTNSPVQELSELGWKVSADYKFNESSMVFASISEGFKGGSYDNRALATGDALFGPEFLTAYEIGYKGSNAANTLQFTAAYYFYDWEDLQIFESYGGVPVLVNIPGVEITGVEAALTWAPTDQWYVQASVGTADSEVVDISGLDPRSEAEIGKEVTNTPDVTANLLASYTFPIGGNDLAISANYRYTSSMFYTFTQTNIRDESSDYSFLNARVAYTFGSNDQFNVAAWGNNLTEEFACSSVIWGPGAPPQGNYSCEVAAYGEALYGVTFEAGFGGN
jgi:iron complex outermembrane receptor protein